jgi:hypothetical protein
MKRISLLLAFVAFFATACFATSKVENSKLTVNKNVVYKKGDLSFNVISIETNLLTGTTCTVSASWTNEDGKKSNIQLTVTCESCTTIQQACNQAYALLSIIIPG